MKLRILTIFTILTAVLLLSSCIVTSHDFNADISCDEFSQNSHRSGEFKMEVGNRLSMGL